MVACLDSHMPDSQMVPGVTERQQLVSGIVALALAAVCIFALPVLGTEGLVGGSVLGLLSVVFLVIGTLSIGTSEQVQV
jgi:hypothetical protein